MYTCRIVLADDHVLIRKGLRRILEVEAGIEVVGEVSDGLELLSFLQKNSPDLVLLDISMPNLRGIEAIAEAKKINPKVKILILTMHSSKDFLCSAYRAGADGYLLKEDSDTELLTAITDCLAGRFYISPVLSNLLADKSLKASCNEKLKDNKDLTIREKQVLTMVAEGKKSKDVAELLSISIRTVEHHRANIMKKTNIGNTAELIKYAIQKGFINQPE
jgi:DNA-binding NarL/FixJ family response regulator